MKKVLFIAYHFPPIAGGGTFRSLKFVKYLPQFGWLPTVLTVDTKLSWAYDYDLLKEIPKDVKVLRVKQFEWFYFHIFFSKLKMPWIYELIKDRFLIPDIKVGWVFPALRKARKELQTNHYDLIFSTSPTPCAHIIAMKLASKYKLPWICDFRDFWTLHSDYKFHNTKRFIKERSLEKIILFKSNKVITVSDGLKRKFIEAFPFLPSDKIQTITNGYDQEIFNFKMDNNKFNITYTGSFYGPYNPIQFLKAVKNCINKNSEFKKNIQVNFIGNISDDVIKQINNFIPQHSEIVKFQNPVQLKKYIINSSVLLLILPADNHYNAYIPVKLFDYLSYSKPILSIIPAGDSLDILRKCGKVYHALPENIKNIETVILNLFSLWKTGHLDIEYNTNFIQNFHRKKLTKQLAEVFDSVI